jgi:hypothetical protein
MSLERGGDWEELPYDMVDWDATNKWEKTHSGPYESSEAASPAMKEAAEIDKEEAAERNEMMARMPEVAKGLELPDQDGVFARRDARVGSEPEPEESEGARYVKSHGRPESHC